MEINTESQPWTMTDVTDSIDQEGVAERAQRAQQRSNAVKDAAELLTAEILRRETEGEPVPLKRQAEEFLTSRGVKQRIARDAISSPAFEMVEVVGKGHPKGVHLAGQNDGVNRNTTPTAPAPDKDSGNADFGQPHPEQPTEIDPQEPQCSLASQEGAIPVEASLFAPPRNTEIEKPGGTGSIEEGPSCYEIEPGRWVHHPWNGCTTPMPPAKTTPVIEQTCWHCVGEGKCRCIGCSDATRGISDECTVCHGAGKVCGVDSINI
jgi:hypothetical protein